MQNNSERHLHVKDLAGALDLFSRARFAIFLPRIDDQLSRQHPNDSRSKIWREFRDASIREHAGGIARNIHLLGLLIRDAEATGGSEKSYGWES
jgi:hypothetical protein